MDKQLLAHLKGLSQSEMKAKATKVRPDIIEELEELCHEVDDDLVEVLDRAVLEIMELRNRVDNLTARVSLDLR